ncbi:YugN family protein [Rummeliibacillus pycnus]|uniref:YugN family protein n=1 Tax=Rummeliibacillus pycnus TaxID=101070 RepID=UPI000C99E3EB|nr:YugN family protein [Rummeliibacillus pycnus]
MYFENTGLENKVAHITLLDDLMRQHSLIRATGWDYERITWDRKFVVQEGTYYLRIFGISKDGDNGSNDSNITLLKPVLGKHYFPHGIEYGEDEIYPANLVKSCQDILASLSKQLDQFIVQA